MFLIAIMATLGIFSLGVMESTMYLKGIPNYVHIIIGVNTIKGTKDIINMKCSMFLEVNRR